MILISMSVSLDSFSTGIGLHAITDDYLLSGLIFSICVLYLIPVIFIFLNLGNLRFIWIMFLIESIMIYFNNFVVFIGNIINFPIEKLVYLYYKIKETVLMELQL